MRKHVSHRGMITLGLTLTLVLMFLCAAVLWNYNYMVMRNRDAHDAAMLSARAAALVQMNLKTGVFGNSFPEYKNAGTQGGVNARALRVFQENTLQRRSTHSYDATLTVEPSSTQNSDFPLNLQMTLTVDQPRKYGFLKPLLDTEATTQGKTLNPGADNFTYYAVCDPYVVALNSSLDSNVTVLSCALNKDIFNGSNFLDSFYPDNAVQNFSMVLRSGYNANIGIYTLGQEIGTAVNVTGATLPVLQAGQTYCAAVYDTTNANKVVDFIAFRVNTGDSDPNPNTAEYTIQPTYVLTQAAITDQVKRRAATIYTYSTSLGALKIRQAPIIKKF